MKSIIIILISFLLTLNGYAQSETRRISEFSFLEISKAFEVILTHGDNNELRIEAEEEKYLKNVITSVSRNKLKISSKGKIKGLIKIYLTYKKLNGIEQRGASELINTNTLKANKFYLNGSGASETKLDLDVKELKVDFSGASEIKLSGNADVVNFDFSGASELKAFNLKSKYAIVNISGATRAKINASEMVTGAVSGVSDIKIKGKGKINIEQSGLSYISKR